MLSLVDFNEIDRQTPELLRLVGADPILQGHLLRSDHTQHAHALLTLAQPPRDGIIVDVGCGFGGLARVWQEWRPDLQWWLVNGSQAQLDAIPPHPRMATLHCRAEDLQLGNGVCDMAVFTYALCQMDPYAALAEAHRVTKLGGTLFLYEPVSTTPYHRIPNAERREKLWAQFDTMPSHLKMAESLGWRCTLAQTFEPQFEPLFEHLLEHHNLTKLLDGVVPAVMRFTKEW